MQLHLRARLTRALLLSFLMATAGLFMSPVATSAERPRGGTIEICLGADIAPAGTPIQLSLNHGAPFSVAAGRCTGARAITPGPVTVSVVTDGVTVAGVTVRPSQREISDDLQTRSATVGVPGGSTAATRTIVTFTGLEGGSGSSPGVIEVCKASANGMADKAFGFSLNGGPPFTVLGGDCSGPLTTRAGMNVVTELSSAEGQASEITVLPAARLGAVNLAAQRVTASVPAGIDPEERTTVTFTNAPPGGPTVPGSGTGELTICKVSRTPSFQGRLFSFSLNAGPAFSIEAGTPQSPVCGAPISYAVGTRILVRELEMPNVVVDSITVSDGRGSDIDPANRSATATIGTGTTVVTFDNEPAPLPQLGYIEVCKDAEGPDVSGSFDFTITAPGFVRTDSTFVGQCTAPIEVPAGNVTVVEASRAGIELYTVFAVPSVRLFAANLINRSVTVEVPVGDASTETQVHFVNRAITGQLKVCKALAPGSDALADSTALFDVTRHAEAVEPGTVQRVRVLASTAATQCVVAGAFPVGEQIRVDEVFREELVQGDPDAGIALSGDSIDVTGEGVLTITPGVNSLTVTNRALGLLELCKAPVAGLTIQPTFHFRIDGGGIVAVRAGACTPPIHVSVGEHTVVEIAASDYELDLGGPGGGIQVVPAEREVTRNPGLRTATATVPFGISGETRVMFWNRIKQGSVKVCKDIAAGSQDSLGSARFDYTVTVGGAAHRLEDIAPGECSLPLPPADVLRPDGSQTVVTVQEDGAGPAAMFEVQAIACSSCRSPITPDLAAGAVQFALAPGTSAVTYTNAIRP